MCIVCERTSSSPIWVFAPNEQSVMSTVDHKKQLSFPYLSTSMGSFVISVSVFVKLENLKVTSHEPNDNLAVLAVSSVTFFFIWPTWNVSKQKGVGMVTYQWQLSNSLVYRHCLVVCVSNIKSLWNAQNTIWEQVHMYRYLETQFFLLWLHLQRCQNLWQMHRQAYSHYNLLQLCQIWLILQTKLMSTFKNNTPSSLPTLIPITLMTNSDVNHFKTSQFVNSR